MFLNIVCKCNNFTQEYKVFAVDLIVLIPALRHFGGKWENVSMDWMLIKLGEYYFK